MPKSHLDTIWKNCFSAKKERRNSALITPKNKLPV